MAKRKYEKPAMTEHKLVAIKPTRCPNCRSYETRTYEKGQVGLLYICNNCEHMWSGVIVGRPRRMPAYGDRSKFK